MTKMTISNVSVYAFRVAIRWCAMRGFPEKLDDWSEDQAKTLQAVADECDRRRKPSTNGLIIRRMTNAKD